MLIRDSIVFILLFALISCGDGFSSFADDGSLTSDQPESSTDSDNTLPEQNDTNDKNSNTDSQSDTGTSTSSSSGNQNGSSTGALVINETFQIVGRNQPVTFSATLDPEYSGSSEIIWESSNYSVLSVDSNGYAEPHTIGEVTIVARTSDENLSTAIEIMVLEYPGYDAIENPADGDKSSYSANSNNFNMTYLRSDMQFSTSIDDSEVQTITHDYWLADTEVT
jgi:hypothetical protein